VLGVSVVLLLLRYRRPMRQNFRFVRAPLISWTLIAAIFIGGLPMFTGVAITGDTRPGFTLDVCHPVGAASYNVSQTEAPLIPTHIAFQLPRASGAAPELAPPFFPQVSKAPDPPPPKIGV
jgi:hypothetical protein